ILSKRKFSSNDWIALRLGSAQAARNIKEHGVTFEEASTVFSDPNGITIPDEAHSNGEDREITIGISHRLRIVVVSHTERAGITRIISARKATRNEVLQFQGI